MTTQSLRTSPAVAIPRALVSARARVSPAVIVGAAGGLVVWTGSWIPSFWGDEAASVMSAERPLGSLFSVIGRVDAVHGSYYLFLHFWIRAFGSSELSVRAPSAIATAIGIAGVVMLVGMFSTTRLAVITGIVYTLIPRISWGATEARSYAMTAAVAVWLTVWLVHLLRTPVARRRSWLAFGVVLGLSAWLFLYLVLLVPSYLLVTALSPGVRPRLKPLLLASGAAMVVAAPIALIASRERAQIAFLAHRGYLNPDTILVTQWFGWVPCAVVCWILIVAAIADRLAARPWRTVVRAADPAANAGLSLVLLAAVWVLMPTGLLILGDLTISPMYNARYLTFTSPAIVILIVVGAVALPGLAKKVVGSTLSASGTSAITLIALGAVMLVAAPAYIDERTPFAKDGGSDLRQAAATVARISAPGEAVVFDQATRPSERPRLALHLYPNDFDGLADVGLAVPYAERPGLWDAVTPVTALAPALERYDTVLAVELRGTSRPVDVTTLESFGFRLDAVHHTHRSDVYTLVRESS